MPEPIYQAASAGAVLAESAMSIIFAHPVVHEKQKFSDFSLTCPDQSLFFLTLILFLQQINVKAHFLSYSADPVQMPQNMASNQGRQFLLTLISMQNTVKVKSPETP